MCKNFLEIDSSRWLWSNLGSFFFFFLISSSYIIISSQGILSSLAKLSWRWDFHTVVGSSGSEEVGGCAQGCAFYVAWPMILHGTCLLTVILVEASGLLGPLSVGCGSMRAGVNNVGEETSK